MSTVKLARIDPTPEAMARVERAASRIGPMMPLRAINEEWLERREAHDEFTPRTKPVLRTLETMVFDGPVRGSAARASNFALKTSRFGNPPGGIPTAGIQFQCGPGAEHGHVPGLCDHGQYPHQCGACPR